MSTDFEPRHHYDPTVDGNLKLRLEQAEGIIQDGVRLSMVFDDLKPFALALGVFTFELKDTASKLKMRGLITPEKLPYQGGKECFHLSPDDVRIIVALGYSHIPNIRAHRLPIKSKDIYSYYCHLVEETRQLLGRDSLAGMIKDPLVKAKNK